MLSKTLLLSALALTLTDGSSALAADSAHGRDTEAWIAGTMTPQALDALLKSALAAAPAGLAEAASVMTVDGAGQFDNSRPEAPPAWPCTRPSCQITGWRCTMRALVAFEYF